MRRALQMLAILVVVALNGIASAAAPTIRAQVSETRVSVGQQFVYSAEVIAEGATTQVPEPQLPDFAGLTVVQDLGVSQSSSIQIINNAQSATVSVARRVILTADHEGTVTIAPAKVVADGKTLPSNSITINVAKPDTSSLPETMKNANILPAQTNSSTIDSQLAGRLFMLGAVDNAEPYEGQPVRVTYTVYTDIEPQTNAVDSWLHPQTAGLPDGDYDHVSIFNLAVPRGQPRPVPSAELKQMDGKTYRAIKGFECYCLPRHAGTIKIGPYHLLAGIPVRRSNDPFGFPSIFDDNSVTAVLPTTPIMINVKPLPTQGRPADAASVVIGDFQMKAELDRQQMTQDELVTLRLTLEGRGNVVQIPEPSAKAFGPFEVFDKSKKDLLPAANADGLRGGCVYEYVLRAKESGALTLPQIKVAQFNPWTEQYQEIASQALPIQVDPSNGVPEVFAATSMPQAQSAAVKEVGQGMAYIETSGFRGMTKTRPSYEDPLVWGLQAVPLLLIGGAYGLRRRREWREANWGHVRKRGARAVANKRLRQAAALCKPGQADAFYAELSTGLRGYFGDKFGRPATGLRFDEVEEELLRRNVELAMAQEAGRLLEQSDSARFSPASADPEVMRETLEKAQQLLGSLERVLG